MNVDKSVMILFKVHVIENDNTQIDDANQIWLMHECDLECIGMSIVSIKEIFNMSNGKCEDLN